SIIQRIEDSEHTAEELHRKSWAFKMPSEEDRLAFKCQPWCLAGRLTPKRVEFWALNARIYLLPNTDLIQHF
ncbi:hypothetical protein S245_024107, partial [Arachis hypogaea]